jgi:3-oxoadipate CoA-transferase beta subunit
MTASNMTSSDMTPLNRLQITWRAAQDIEDGQVVNLGIGLPVYCSDYLRPGIDVIIQAENGVIGAGPLAGKDKADTDLVDAGSRRITLNPGASIVDSSWSFAMIRGGHIDVTILGAFEVAANGDLANWDMRVPNRGPLVGGAMDLAASARQVWIIMEHTTRKGAPRLLEKCALPLTAVRCVSRVYTDLAVVDVTPQGFLVREMIAGISRDDLQAKSGAPLSFAADCKVLTAPPIALPE